MEGTRRSSVARTPPAGQWVSSDEPGAGTLFATRYEIRSVLGAGGMGIVYGAHDRELEDLVAIKMLRNEALSADPSLLARFKQEIRLARRITHPNILRTHDLGEWNGLKFLSMELVEGVTLDRVLASGGFSRPRWDCGSRNRSARDSPQRTRSA